MDHAARVRRQWGTERRAGAAPVMHPVPSRRAMSGARFALFLTIAAWVAYFGEQVRRYVDHPFGVRGTVEAVVYLLLVTLLTASAVGYLLARLGHLQRVRAHRREPRAVIDAAFDESNPTLTAIVPSYQEDHRVIRQTLLSAALQEFPNLRVVLLIDDPPAPTSDLASGSSPRRAPCRARSPRCSSCLARRFEEALDAFETSRRRARAVAEDVELLAATYYRRRLLAPPHRPRTRSYRPRRRVPRERDRPGPRDRPRDGRRCAARRGRRERRDQRRAHAPALPAPRVDLPGRAVELRAQAVRLALARAEQGDEPQQLHRPDGRPLPHPRDRRAGALPCRSAAGTSISRCRTPTTC